MGGQSGGGGHTPYEAPDSLRSAQKLSAIGLISLGPIKGPVNKWKSTYFDKTPIQNENGVDDNDADSFNFKNTEIQFTLGTQDQLPLQGFESSQREVSVGTEIKQARPITRTVIDPDVTRVRITLGVNALFEQNDQGDTNASAVDLEILVNGRSYRTCTIEGKTSSRFYRSYIIDNLPEKPFNIQVKRITPDSKTQKVQNATVWSSYTEIIDTKLSYPNMAMVGIKTDSRYNPNFPTVNFLLYGRIIKVPSNYDPETRTYSSQFWKGDFKLAWSNNPAWIFYDLVTNELAGLGKRINEFGIDKFQLYQIAQYCDVLVDDGYGGKEPRMTANLWITEQREAYQVISDMASVFRAIAVWNGTQFTAIQDRPTDPVCSYTQANVIDGKFSRQFTPLKSIYTAVEVEYADKNNMYQKAIEYVADDAMIARYGYNVKKITAFACTSRGQARRYGKWVLETSRLEQCTITFSVGREGLRHLPGDIIEVADNTYANTHLGGRVITIDGQKVTLDLPISLAGDSYLAYQNEQMQMQRVKIRSLDKENANIAYLDAIPTGLNVQDYWVLQTAQSVQTQRYRSVSIVENEEGSFTITALQHEPQKEAIVDGSASFTRLPTSAYQGGLLPVSQPEISTDGQGIKLTFNAPHFVGQGLKYQVKLYRNGNLHHIYDDLPEPELAFNDLSDGDYIAEIRAKNGAGQLSEPVTTHFTINLKISELVALPRIFAIELQWKNPLFAQPNSVIEIWAAETQDFTQARRLVNLPYPSNSYTYSGLGINDRYCFWARITNGDTAGEFCLPVEGKPEQSAVKLTEYLEGQITKTELGQSLIKELTDINNAVSEEAQQRQQAVANAISQITTQAQTLGTAIQRVEQTEKEQARQLSTLTAKAEQALSGITAEQKARAEGDKANADNITALTARVGNAESSVSRVESAVSSLNSSTATQLNRLSSELNGAKSQITQTANTVAGLNGKVSSTHTVKTQAISGGRTAIAGIALGATADNKTVESSVIVMADKFSVVKNAGDGQIKPVFSVVNGKTAVNGDLIADGTILGRHLKANETITSPVINGGTIKGTNIVGNTINGGTINGSTINGGVIKGVRLEGVTGKFTGELEVTQLVGGNIFDANTFIAKRTGNMKYKTFRENAHNSMTTTECYHEYKCIIRVPAIKRKRKLVHSPYYYGASGTRETFYGGEKHSVSYDGVIDVTESVTPPIQNNVLLPNIEYTLTSSGWCREQGGKKYGGEVTYSAVLLSEQGIAYQI